MHTEVSLSINENTKISTLIEANPQVIETLVKLNAHFSKLRNPFLRNILAKRVTISEACKMSGCNITDFFITMEGIGFNVNAGSLRARIPQVSHNGRFILPENFEIIELDVRPVLVQKKDPLNLIISKIGTLQAGQCLKIVNTFEPVPLINLLGKKGFQHHVEYPDKDTVITWFFKQGKEKVGQILPDDTIKANESDDFEWMLQKYQPPKLQFTDVRELEMPLPMVTILAILKKMPQDEALLVHHKKVPVFLLPELREQGFDYRIKNISEGNLNILIFKV